MANISLGVINNSYVNNSFKIHGTNKNMSRSYQDKRIIAHKGSLLRRNFTVAETGLDKPIYHSIEISPNLTLHYDRIQYERITKLFSIIDTDSKGYVTKKQVNDFVFLRCPLFRRRDDLLTRLKNKRKGGAISNFMLDAEKHMENIMGFKAASTFDEVWEAVISSDASIPPNQKIVLGIEGFAIFCRFIALAQYLEAKQRFSQRHLQQTSAEVVMVEVPPPLPPGPLNMDALKEYEDRKCSENTPFPELDLNHCLVASHDDYYGKAKKYGRVVISPFGMEPTGNVSSSSSIDSLSEEEFVLTYSHSNEATSIVRRTKIDMEWLYDTIKSHRVLGGTLCGRILPPFPKKSSQNTSYGIVNTIVKNIIWGITPTNTTNESSDVVTGYYSKQLERCLNYLLEHPALFSSFPLNAILKASQIGLQAAKDLLEEEETPQKLHSIELPASESSFLSNLSWVRTAAQAAMALKLHGILEATGYSSTSARLQHASLPNLDTSRSLSLWRGECTTPPPTLERTSSNEKEKEYDCFENGVIRIQSELDNDTDDDYDLLPSPCTITNTHSHILKSQDTSKRYSYGPEHSSSPSIDSDIEKLSEIITSVHSTLRKCSTVSQSIANAKKERETFHLNIVQKLDSWISLRGYELMNERALLNAVSSLDRCLDVRVKSDAALNDDLGWQASLASSAVSATQDVKSAIQACNTATSAKAAAESAALSAQKACETSTTSNPEEVRILRTRASISHSHAIYAAVIQHESFVAKRKAALALAHDVHFWNLYRKREILKTCLDVAKAQKEAAGKAVESWELLRMGLFGHDDCVSSPVARKERKKVPNISPSTVKSCSKIVPVDHVALAPKHIPPAPPFATDKNNDNDFAPKISSKQSKESIPIDRTTDEKENNDVTPQRDTQEGDLMTSSMQSLVDGLMTWGFAQGQYDPQDDMSLPTGMAVSIALEESANASNTPAK